jgi:phosphoglycolate phosphatase
MPAGSSPGDHGGDAGPDIGVARRAGIPVIGVEFGYTEVPIAISNRTC